MRSGHSPRSLPLLGKRQCTQYIFFNLQIHISNSKSVGMEDRHWTLYPMTSPHSFLLVYLLKPMFVYFGKYLQRQHLGESKSVGEKRIKASSRVLYSALETVLLISHQCLDWQVTTSWTSVILCSGLHLLPFEANSWLKIQFLDFSMPINRGNFIMCQFSCFETLLNI